MEYKRGIFVMLLVVAMLLEQPEFVQANQTDLAAWSVQTADLSNSVQNQPESDEDSKYHITYFLNGGVLRDTLPVSYTEEELPIVLSIPEREGYNFAGWYTDSSYRNKITVLTEAKAEPYMLFAKWTTKIRSGVSIQRYSYTIGAAGSDSEKNLTDCRYDFLENIIIPGMPATREADYKNHRISTEGQCPQGLCMTEDYCLITAYCSDGGENYGSLFILDRNTGEYLATLGMKKNSHLGGLAFDGQNVWLCHSNSRTLECISYSYIRKIASERPRELVDCSELFTEYRVSNTPSCITCHDGQLWVATHNPYYKSIMISYRYMGDRLVEQARFQVPEKVQGIAFDEANRVYLSTSYGRTKSSYLRVYESVAALNARPGAPVIRVEMPPCSEELCYDEGSLYILFESAAMNYFEGTDGRGTSICPIDQILTVTTQSVLGR